MFAAVLLRSGTGIASMLRAVPVWLWVVGACIAYGALQRHRATVATTTLATQQADAAKAREQALSAAIQRTTTIIATQGNAIEKAHTQAQAVDQLAAQSAAALQRLRNHLAAVKAGAGATGATAIAIGQTNRAADALAICADRYRNVAEIADRAVIAGRACEASYEALVQKP